MASLTAPHRATHRPPAAPEARARSHAPQLLSSGAAPMWSSRGLGVGVRRPFRWTRIIQPHSVNLARQSCVGAKASTTCGFVGLVRTNHEPLYILLLIPCATGVALIALIHVSPPIISIAWGSPPTFASSVCAHCCRLCVSANPLLPVAAAPRRSVLASSRCDSASRRERPRGCAAKRDDEFSSPDTDYHATLQRGSCNAGNDITPGRAALREFDPAYVSCGSTPEVAVWATMSVSASSGQRPQMLTAAWCRTKCVAAKNDHAIIGRRSIRQSGFLESISVSRDIFRPAKRGKMHCSRQW